MAAAFLPLLLSATLAPAVASAQPAAVKAGPPYSAILISQKTGELLYSRSPDLIVHPASITKMMTLYLAFTALETGKLSLSDPVFFSAHAAAQKPSKLAVPVGKSLSVDEVIRAIAVKSANDAAVALAEKLDGSEIAFATRMTRVARSLGMNNTQFVNASGLSNPGQLTTARDISLLAQRIIERFPSKYRYFSTRNFSYAKASWVNHNHLLGKVQGVDGIKTGYTLDAGFTLAASAERDGHRLIAVVLGAKSRKTRDEDVTRLLELGFTGLHKRSIGEPMDIAAAFEGTGAGAPPLPGLGIEVEQGSASD